jgi:hypothetical protein
LHNAGATAEWQVHLALFQEEAGLSAADIDLIRGAGEPEERDSVALRLADAVCAWGNLPDDLWADLEAALGTAGAVEAVFVGAQYLKVAVMNNAFKVVPPFPVDDLASP